MPEFRITPAAERDLEDIWRYSVRTWGIVQAAAYTDEMVPAFSRLAGAPELGRKIDHIRAGYRCWRMREHVVYYRLAAYGVEVVRILHVRMDPPRHL
jgi:toxin ParE1/3/4